RGADHGTGSSFVYVF
nr:immunoglobulin light chain junction region [Macaca mulatta]